MKMTRISAVALATLAVAWARAGALECGDEVLDPPAEQCDDGNFFGGDGCSASCTNESPRDFPIDSSRSFAATQLSVFSIGFSLTGNIRLIAGEPAPDGFVPVVLRDGDVQLERVAVPGLVCACTTVPENTRAYGPGNGGFGGVECGTGPPAPERLFRVPASVRLTRDHNTIDEDPLCESGEREPADGPHPGVCNGRLQLEPQGQGGKGSAVVVSNLNIRLIRDGGVCSTDTSDPRKGADGIPCTADDPSGPDDPAQLVRIDPAGAFTGTIEAAVIDANNVPGSEIRGGRNCGSAPCAVLEQGAPIDCDYLLANPGAPITSGALALAFPILDAEEIGDSVVTVKLVPQAGTPATPGEATVTPTVTEPAPPSPTPTRGSGCQADCNGDGEVTVDELILGVNIALGSRAADQCPAFDSSGDDQVTIDELVAGVRAALEGCPR